MNGKSVRKTTSSGRAIKRRVRGHRAAILLFCASALVSCTGGPVRTGTDAPLSPGVPRVTLEAGPGYSRLHWFGIFPYTVTPQIAVWAETEDGSFAGTLFITKKAAAGSWEGGKDIERPEALPVFFERSAEKTGSGTLDASSSATPKPDYGSPYSSSAALVLRPGRYRILAEVNSSFDFNAAWPESPTDVNGQPSLLYAGELRVGGNSSQVVLEPLGRSFREGNTVGVMENFDGITTAMDLVESIGVSVKGETSP